MGRQQASPLPAGVSRQLAVAVWALVVTLTSSFTSPWKTTTTRSRIRRTTSASSFVTRSGTGGNPFGLSWRSSSSSPWSLLKASSSGSSSDRQNLVVISPPNGLGETVAVRAACRGFQVKWFVVGSFDEFAMTAATQATMQRQGGDLQVAGVNATDLLAGAEGSSLRLMQRWCAFEESESPSSLIVTYDDEAAAAQNAAADENDDDEGTGWLGLLGEAENVKSKKREDELAKKRTLLIHAIRVAARQAATSMPLSMKMALLAPDDDNDEDDNNERSDSSEEGLFSIFGFGGNEQKGSVSIPPSLVSAMGGPREVSCLRPAGSLIGRPPSSPGVTPFLGGPRRRAVLRDEYTLQQVRVDPFVSVTGMALWDAARKDLTAQENKIRVSRLSVAEAAVRSLQLFSHDAAAAVDLCITSQRGLEPPSEEEWTAELQAAWREATLGTSASSSAAAVAHLAEDEVVVFSCAFGDIPSRSRFVDWLATKWAPAVLRTYDIAAIRTGARPVSASRVDSPDRFQAQVVWQELVDISSAQTATVGRLILDVSSGTNLIAYRTRGEPGQPVSPTPLKGEAVLIRRLAEAVTQAMEKGLATKRVRASPTPATTTTTEEEVEETSQVEVESTTKVATATATASTTAVEEPPAPPPPPPAAATTSDSGPRARGARRSKERARGSKKKKKKSSKK